MRWRPCSDEARFDLSVNIERIEPSDAGMLKAYAAVQMGLTVESVLEVEDGLGASSEGGFSLREVTIKKPWYKDYVDIETGDGVEWLQRFVCAHNS